MLFSIPTWEDDPMISGFSSWAGLKSTANQKRSQALEDCAGEEIADPGFVLEVPARQKYEVLGEGRSSWVPPGC